MERKLTLIAWVVAGVLSVSPMVAAKPGHENQGVRDHGQGIGRGKGQGGEHRTHAAKGKHRLPKQEDTDDIVDDFCEDVAEDIQDVVDDSADISEDLGDAVADFARCLDRSRDVEDAIECSVKMTNEVADAHEEAANSCTDFAEDFFGDIERALQDAEDDGLVEEFLEDPEVTEKLITGLSVLERCSTALNP